MSGATCSTCVHFDTPVDPSELPWGHCGLAGSEGGKPDHGATLAIAQDSEDFGAWLRVSPDFGCVQWAAAAGCAQ